MTKANEQEKIDNLINWGEVSRRLSGSRCVILRNKVPAKHADSVQQLRMAVDNATKNWEDPAKLK